MSEKCQDCRDQLMNCRCEPGMLRKIADLERQLAAITAERDSEQAWAHEYHSQWVEAERHLAEVRLELADAHGQISQDQIEIFTLKSDLTACRAAIGDVTKLLFTLTGEHLVSGRGYALVRTAMMALEGKTAPAEKPRMMKGHASMEGKHRGIHEENNCCRYAPTCTPVEPAPDVCRWVYDSRMGFHRTDKCGHQYKELMTDNKCPQCGKPVVVANAVPVTTEPGNETPKGTV